MPRAAVIAALVVVLVGTGILDRAVARPGPTPAVAVSALSATAVGQASAESTSWYCTGGTGSQGGAPATIVLTSAARHAVTGTVTVIPAVTGPGSPQPWAQAQSQQVSVPAGGQVALGPAQLGAVNFLAVAVVLDGGGVSVAQSVSSPLGWSAAPCSSATSSSWYFAHGATAQGGGLVLALFNPSSTNAAVNVTLVSGTAGLLAPAAYQGVDVGPGSLVLENLGDHAPDDSDLATEVRALSGSVVAAELEATGTPGNGGLSIIPGAAATAGTWVFPQSQGLSGGSVDFHVFNPSTTPVAVTVAIGLMNGAAAEPLRMRVPPEGVATLAAASQIRIPGGSPYALTFRTSGPGVVVSRQVQVPPGIAPPIPEVGEGPGVPGSSTRWLLPALGAPSTGAWSLAIIDLGTAAGSVRLSTPAGVEIAAQPARQVQPGVPLVIGPGLGPPFGTAPFVVSSTQPVAVELDALPVAGPGVVVVPAFPPR